MNKSFFVDIFIGPLTWTVDISGLLILHGDWIIVHWFGIGNGFGSYIVSPQWLECGRNRFCVGWITMTISEARSYLYFLLWESRDYLRPCSDRQPVSVNDSLRFLSRKAILISFSGKRTAANLFQNLFEFGKSLGAMDEKLQLFNLWRSFLRIEITFNTLNLSFAYCG